MSRKIQKPEGKFGVLIPGMGAVTTTFMAGVDSIRKGYSYPIGSLTQIGRIRLGKRTDNYQPFIKEIVPLADLNDLEFFCWDVFPDNAYEAAARCKVLNQEDLNKHKDFLSSINANKAVFNRKFVKKLDGNNVKNLGSHREHIKALKDEIKKFKKEKNISRLVMIGAGSTEVYSASSKIHQTLENYERALDDNNPDIPPSQIYAYAAISEGIPFINGAPNFTTNFPAMIELSKKTGANISGRDFKTGQTLIKTIISPGIKSRLLGLNGWFSTNILGNRDGEVLDDPDSFKTKEISKLSVLDSILEPDIYPDLYGDYYHKVRINYYPPRGDNKEGWDNIDISGWMGYPMQIKIDFLCRDSILAAPIMLDLVLFADFAKRAGLSGIQEWLSFYFKSPQAEPHVHVEHDLFIQQMKLKNTLRFLMGKEQVTHFDTEDQH
jgi:myo-inositol-1-phosphate synthase